MAPKLADYRRIAAESSKGISNDAIYQMALSLISAEKVEGCLLEFGAGKGALISTLLSRGYRGSITGADILPRAADLPPEINWIEADLNNPLPLTDTSFDAIISTEVIEHLENPRAIFREFHRLLRRGGKLIVTTPNQESIRSLLSVLVGGHFAAFRDASYPAHITALLRKDFERICKETHFSAPRFFYSNSGGIPKLPHIEWQRLSKRLFSGRLFSDDLALYVTKM